jgi:opacity protein-like surface antigen
MGSFNMKKIILSTVAVMAMGGSLFAGGKMVEPATPVVAPIVRDHDTSGIYVSGAAYYNNVYADDYSWFDDGTDTQDEIAGFTAIVGYNYNEYLAFEARASKEFFKEDYADEYHFSFFAKPQYRFRDANNYEDDYFTIYGLIGFGYVNVEGTDGNTPGDPTMVGETLVDDWQFQYGVGLSYTFVDTDHPENDSGDWSIFAEYTMYMDDQSMDKTYLYDYNPNKYDELSMNGLTIGVSYQF